ncbi:methylesterase 10-like [Syzygium oleosum]|uniref:methylesterase 10-like n=1 Tax=Syzygium oleosum TaxID=219896 RepID=UPI0011D2BF93|nr:methylesterase 10-like [Syzygium oleosum]
MELAGPAAILTLRDFVRPLMELMTSLPQNEKVILVGHSYGGFCISLAMESFPEKVEVAVYVAAFMPRPKIPPALLLQEFLREIKLEASMNQKYTIDHNHDRGETDDYMAEKLYQNCPPEDLELAKMLPRPVKMFMEDLADESLLTEERFGSVERIFVVCGDDKLMEADFQRRMIDRSPPKAVKLIEEADHVAMLSKPHELCQCFEDIAKNCS